MSKRTKTTKTTKTGRTTNRVKRRCSAPPQQFSKAFKIAWTAHTAAMVMVMVMAMVVMVVVAAATVAAVWGWKITRLGLLQLWQILLPPLQPLLLQLLGDESTMLAARPCAIQWRFPATANTNVERRAATTTAATEQRPLHRSRVPRLQAAVQPTPMDPVRRCEAERGQRPRRWGRALGDRQGRASTRSFDPFGPALQRIPDF